MTQGCAGRAESVPESPPPGESLAHCRARCEELEALLAEAERASLSKTRLLAVASHDLRQPLHTMGMLTAMLSRKVTDPAVRPVLELLETANRALREQLDSLLDLSRLDAGVIKPNPEVFRLDQMVELHARHIAPLVAAQGLELVVVCGQPVVVESDPGLLTRLLGNLTSNALKFTKTGHVALEVVVTGGDVLVVVDDTGLGIPEDQQGVIFEEFVQLHNAQKDVTRGLGLGLAIVKRLCKLLNAGIRLSSAPGRGSRFEIALPLAAQAKAVTKKASPSSVVAAGTGHKVVLAGEPCASLLSTRSVLEMAGYKVALVSDARLALMHIRSGQASVLISEARLGGGIQGVDLMAQAMREAPGLRAALLMSDTASERIPSLRALGIAVFFKPLAPPDLLDWLVQLPDA